MPDKKEEPKVDATPKQQEKKDYDKIRAEYKSEVFDPKDICNECIDIQDDLGKTIADAKLPGESFVNQEDFDYINDFEPNLGKRFGKMWPVMCSGGIAFGTFVLYRSTVDKIASKSKFLLR